jgi:hypothetical protein
MRASAAGVNRQPTAKGLQSIVHVLESGSPRCEKRVEADAVVSNLEPQTAVEPRDVDCRSRSAGMLGHVLQCLGAAEVGGRLNLSTAPLAVRLNLHVDRHPTSKRRHGAADCTASVATCASRPRLTLSATSCC